MEQGTNRGPRWIFPALLTLIMAAWAWFVRQRTAGIYLFPLSCFGVLALMAWLSDQISTPGDDRRNRGWICEQTLNQGL